MIQTEKLEVLDLIINVLCDHEEKLAGTINKLDKIVQKYVSKTLNTKTYKIDSTKKRRSVRKTKDEVKFKDVMPKMDSAGNLVDICNENIKIVSFELLPPMGNLGEGAIVTIERENGVTEKRHTFSKVLIKQLKTIAPILRQKKVCATISKKKNYYTFE